MSNVPEGHGFVAGRSRQTALRLLLAADNAGVEQTSILSVRDGYHAPEAVIDAYNELGAEPEFDDSFADQFNNQSFEPVETNHEPYAPTSVANGEGESAILAGDDAETEPETPTESDEDKAAREEQEADDAEAKRLQDAADEKATADAGKLAQPAGNAKAEDWLAYAKQQDGYDEATDADLSRDELKEKFGSK